MNIVNFLNRLPVGVAIMLGTACAIGGEAQPNAEPRWVIVATYPAMDQVAAKRIADLFAAAKIKHLTVGSRGHSVSVSDSQAKLARETLAKAVLDGTLNVTLFREIESPRQLRFKRTGDRIEINADRSVLDYTPVVLRPGLRSNMHWHLTITRKDSSAKAGVIVDEGGGIGGDVFTHAFDRKTSKLPQPGEAYDATLVVEWFETDAPLQPNWKPQSGGQYKVVLTKRYKLAIGQGQK